MSDVSNCQHLSAASTLMIVIDLGMISLSTMKITLNEYLQYPLTPAVVLVVWAAVAHVEAAVVAVARLAAEVEDDVGVGGVQLHLHTWCSDT